MSVRIVGLNVGYEGNSLRLPELDPDSDPAQEASQIEQGSETIIPPWLGSFQFGDHGE